MNYVSICGVGFTLLCNILFVLNSKQQLQNNVVWKVLEKDVFCLCSSQWFLVSLCGSV